MKQCSKCKEWKDFSEFYKASSKKSGYQSQCKKCRSEHAKTYDRTKSLIKYNSSEKGKTTRQRYQSSQKGITATNHYRRSNKYRSINRQYRVKYREIFPQKARAHDKVTDEIRAGRLLPASSYQCSFCSNQAVHYHHDDYSKPLEIKPVCAQCHADIHKGICQSS